MNQVTVILLIGGDHIAIGIPIGEHSIHLGHGHYRMQQSVVGRFRGVGVQRLTCTQLLDIADQAGIPLGGA